MRRSDVRLNSRSRRITHAGAAAHTDGMSVTDAHATATRPRRHGRRHPHAGGPPGDRTAEAHRLLWRAGFGPRPGEVARFAALSRRDAVLALTRPKGAGQLVGP